VWAKDASGNVSSSQSADVFFDNIPPTIQSVNYTTIDEYDEDLDDFVIT